MLGAMAKVKFGKQEIEATLTIAGLVWFCVWAGSNVYDYLDKTGHISHVRRSLITADQHWLIGETRNCASVVFGDSGDVTRQIACDDGPEHRIMVKFKGRIERHDKSPNSLINWECTRLEDSFVCKSND